MGTSVIIYLVSLFICSHGYRLYSSSCRIKKLTNIVPFISTGPRSSSAAIKCSTRQLELASEGQGILATFSKKMNTDMMRKILSWSIFSSLLIAMQDFHPIIIGTFFLSHLGSSLIQGFHNLTPQTKKVPRRAIAALYILAMSSLFSYAVVKAQPMILKEAQNCLEIIQSDNPYKIISDAISTLMDKESFGRIEQFLSYILVTSGIVKDKSYEALHMEKLLQHTIQHYTEGAMNFASRMISSSTSILYSTLLSCVFSFMIIWDTPKIASGVARLSKSRLAFVYDEVSPKVTAFGNLLAKSFEVTALTALVNCLLTTLVLLSLKIPGLGFFSVLTFFSSFIPILGIAISTLPPLIVSLVEFGFSKCIQLVLMIAGVHAFEAYVLYPQIYAVKLKMHPLLVTCALVLAEHFFGVAGLLLAVPVTLFLLNQVLFDPKSRGVVSE